MDFIKQLKLHLPNVDLRAPTVSLDGAGLVLLADLTTVQVRTALTGTSTFLDALVICPGIHKQQRAKELNGGEYPACGAMTTGYVFRVENPATVLYLQNIGRTGQLTTVSVSRLDDKAHWQTRVWSKFFSFHQSTFLSSATYLTAVLWTIATINLLVQARDWWGIAVIFLLTLVRICNIIVIRRRSKLDWSGASEPGVKGDLLVLLSQDRWVRMKGMVDDLKAVTSGQWFRDEKQWESWITASATIVVYLDAALANNVSDFGKMALLALFVGSAGLLAIANVATKELEMHGCLLKVDGERKWYKRRVHMAEDLIKETKRDDWAVRMGMIVKRGDAVDPQTDGHKVVTM